MVWSGRMRQDLLPVIPRLLCTAGLFVGCALASCSATLDFDSVSKQSDAVSPDEIPQGDAFSCVDFDPKPTLCDDFDHKSWDEIWSEPLLYPDSPSPGSIANDSDDAVSGDSSLLVTLNEHTWTSNDYVAVGARQTFSD